jgi:lipopolysaccharide assembly outer membrane protein LptD (OstA)
MLSIGTIIVIKTKALKSHLFLGVSFIIRSRKFISFAAGMLEIKKYYAKIAFMLHFAPQSTIVSTVLMFFFTSSLSAQEQKDSLQQNKLRFEQVDSLVAKKISMVNDTTSKGISVSKDAIDKTIYYKTSSKGKIITDIVNRKVILIDGGDVTYGDIELKADSIVLDMQTSTVYATGRPDSVGKPAGTPVFTQGSQETESDTITYNFKTKRAYVKGIRTEQEGGYLHSNTAKMNPDKTIFVDHSTYSTCDAEDPHFYIALKRAKFYPGEKIVSGPAHLVVLDIPLPIFIPYGFFPIQSKKSSGFIMPSFGQNSSMGYSLTNGGFYFAGNEYSDLKLTGSIYTNGSWSGTIESTYKMRYRFNGRFSVSYASNISGYKGMPSYSKVKNYKITWNHTQDAKANPTSTFSANVNMSSTSYDKENSYSVADQNTTTRQSGISYSKTWQGNVTKNFTTSFSHTQNNSTGVVSMTLPSGTFTVSRFYPFKPKNPEKERWYHNIEMQYTAKYRNEVSTYDSILFKQETWKRMNNGFEHDIPVSIPIKAFSNFTVSPALTYSGVLYSRKILKHWDPSHYDSEVNSNVPGAAVNDTVYGAFYGHAIKPSLSASYSPSLYGTYIFTGKNARIQAIRHVIKPSVSFSYVPSFKGLTSDMFRKVQTSETSWDDYSVFDGNVYGAPAAPSRSGSIGFKLDNLLEAKLATADTTGKQQKIKFFDNLSASTSYNIFAKTYKWSDVSTRFQTTIAKNIVVGMGGTFNLYAIDSTGNKYNKFAFSENQGLARLTNYNMSLSFDLAQLLGVQNNKKSGSGQQQTQKQNMAKSGSHNTPETQSNEFDEYGYSVFDMPWSLRVNYSYTYSKPGIKSTSSSSFNFSGSVKFTPKMALTYSSGYDFTGKKMSNTNLGITRDLHCWQMTVSWIPVGSYKSWSFTIQPKAGILQDLKYERKRDRHETY